MCNSLAIAGTAETLVAPRRTTPILTYRHLVPPAAQL